MKAILLACSRTYLTYEKLEMTKSLNIKITSYSSKGRDVSK